MGDVGKHGAQAVRGCVKHVEETTMELFRAHSKIARSRPVTECAQCGEHLFVPEWSEFVDARRVRYLWECEACGYAFETTVRVAAAA